MNSHKHARLTPAGRALLVSRVLERGWTMAAAAEAVGVSCRTGFKWLARFRTEGAPVLVDRSSRPQRSPAVCPAEQVRHFELRRRERVPLWRIARECGRSLATVARHMARLGLSRLSALQPPEPVRRYERETPGELLHIDTKRLGRIKGIGHRITGERQHRNRGIGWDAVHLAIDDHSRVSFARILDDEKGVCCTQFLREAVNFYASLGVKIERVMTDNGSGYVSKAFRAAWQDLGIRISAGDNTHPRPTARLSASCKPACGSGPMRGPTTAHCSAMQRCSHSLTATTGFGHTRP